MPENGGFIRPARGSGINPLQEMPGLFDAALNEFSGKAFDEASLNDIIKAAGLSKGSFYYRFTDKTDLYLCLIDRIVSDKFRYFSEKQTGTGFPAYFFEQIKALAAAGLDYARHEPRYYSFWRRLIAETGTVRQAVRNAFPDAGRDTMLSIVRAARAGGKLRPDLPDEFISAMLQLLFNNIDTLLTADMTDEDISDLVGKLAGMLEKGIALYSGGKAL